MSLRACLVLGLVLVAGSAQADTSTNRVALEMSGVRHGLVVLEQARTDHLVLSAQEIAPPLAALVGAFTQGKTVKKDLRLTAGGVVRKTNDARLASVKLPALGSGGSAEIELAFVAAPLTTQPLLSAKESPPTPAGARITAFRIDLVGMKPVEAPKLEAITFMQKADGSVSTGDLVFEAAAGGGPPFTAWKSHPTPRAVRIEYVGSDGAPILTVPFERCTPSAVVPQGANGTTRVTLSCAQPGTSHP